MAWESRSIHNVCEDFHAPCDATFGLKGAVTTVGLYRILSAKF
jgi:hypothetical protein